jgi:pyrroline-5-carboxylate reductase
MGATYAQSFVHSSSVHPDELYFIDRRPETKQVQSLSSHPVASEPGAWVSAMDLIVVSVKPQDFSLMAQSLKPWLVPNQIVLSIMAGISLDGIQGALGLKKIMRAMPNLPAQVGQGMTVFTASEAVSSREVLQAQNLLNTTGKTLYVEKEALLDAATAISGSGPAFVFYLMQSMIESGRNMGFSEAEAQLLVTQTYLGSLDLLTRNSHTCSEWIRRVSSKGGTTEAGIASFESNHLQQSLQIGLEATRERAVALSKLFATDAPV